MELEELKELWDDSSNSSFPINEEGLSKILNQDSRRPIALIKRNLKLEVLFVILFYGFVIWLISNQVDSNLLYCNQFSAHPQQLNEEAPTSVLRCFAGVA